MRTRAQLLPRHLEKELATSLESARVLNIVGPRQAGKTTLVRDLFGKGRFVTLDDQAVLEAIASDSMGQMQLLLTQAGQGPLIIDEAQRAPSVALAIKRIVDERRRMGQFILTGSSNIFVTRDVADSLAGRVETLTLLPLSAAEVHRRGPSRILDLATTGRGAGLDNLGEVMACTRAQYLDLIVRGGYPEIRSLDERARNRRYRTYVDTIVDRDVGAVLALRKTDAMRRTIEQIAARTGSELNLSELSANVGIQRPTMENYLTSLERLWLAVRLAAWSSGEARREIRHPKIHLLDTGIAAALRNLTPASFAADASPAALGGLLESWVHSELVKSLPLQERHWRLYHWRSDKGREIDIVAEAAPRDLVCFEVKASATITAEDFRHLRWFASEGPGKTWNVTGLVVYLGERVLKLGDGLFALPASAFWSARAAV